MTETSQAPKRTPIFNLVSLDRVSSYAPRAAKVLYFGVRRKPEHVLKQMRLKAA